MLLSLLCALVNADNAQLATASISTNYCALGDTVTFFIDVNIPDKTYSCIPPDLHTIPAFMQSFIMLQKRADVRQTENCTTYSWTIKPTTYGILEVPAIPIIFTDSQTDKKYSTYSSPIPLQVKNNQKKNDNQLQPDVIVPINTSSDVYAHKPRNILFRQPITTSNQQYLWDKANAEMSAEDFINAASSYSQLIRTEARTGEIYYNLGTALLRANRPSDAWQAFARAERYIGNKTEIRHNMTICANMLPNDNFTSWTRTFLKWHFKRGINTRFQLAIACLIVSLLFTMIIIINKGNKSQHQTRVIERSRNAPATYSTALRLRSGHRLRLRSGTLNNRLLLFTTILFISFSTSVAISIIEETAERINEKQQAPEQFTELPHPMSSLASMKLSREIDSPITEDSNELIKLAPNTNKSITATITSSVESPYINQNFTLTQTIQSKAPLKNEIEIINLPPRSILQREPFKELPIKYTQVNGKMQETHTYICQARAQQAGKLTLSPILKAMQVEKMDNEIISVITKSLQLTVQQLPVIDSAEKFSGAIGQFSINSVIFPTNATANDLIKITTTITGKGYIPDKYLPRVSHAPGFILYDPEIINSSKNKKVLEQFLAPLNTTSINVPAIPFTYFDPNSVEYITCTNTQFILN